MCPQAPILGVKTPLELHVLWWSCRESNPPLYLDFYKMSCGFVTLGSGSLPHVTCGFVSALDGVKSRMERQLARGEEQLSPSACQRVGLTCRGGSHR
jgi:hypothetical protein